MYELGMFISLSCTKLGTICQQHILIVRAAAAVPLGGVHLLYPSVVDLVEKMLNILLTNTCKENNTVEFQIIRQYFKLFHYVCFTWESNFNGSMFVFCDIQDNLLVTVHVLAFMQIENFCGSIFGKKCRVNTTMNTFTVRQRKYQNISKETRIKNICTDNCISITINC